MFVEVNELGLLLVHVEGFVSFEQERFVSSNKADFPKEDFSRLSFDPCLKKFLQARSVSDVCFLTSYFKSNVVAELSRQIGIPVSDRQIITAGTSLERASIAKLIYRAAQTFSAPLSKIAILFSDANQLTAIRDARIGSVFVKLGGEEEALALRRVCPDFIVDADHVPVFLGGQEVGFYGEILAFPNAIPHLRRTFKLPKSISAAMISVPGAEDPSLKIWASGRYFDLKETLEDTNPLYHKHPLSVRLIYAKRKGGAEIQAEHIASILEDLIKEATASGGFDVVVSVPPKLDDNRSDRLKIFLEALIHRSKSTGFFNQENVLPNGLVCTKKELVSQKKLNLPRRRQNVEGAYKPNINVKGKRVVVIDDIATTGSTLAEVRKTLLDAGAKSVTLCAIAFHPLAMPSSEKEPRLKCKCGGSLELKATKHGGLFYNCQRWQQGESNERHDTKTFPTGLQELNSRTDKILAWQVQQLPEDVSF